MPPLPTPLKLTPEIIAIVSGAFDSGNFPVLAAVDQNQRPLISFRGSTAVFGPDQLCFWARKAQGGTIEAIKHYPHVALILRSLTAPILQFRGRARVSTDSTVRDKVFSLAHEREQKQDPERKGAAVIIDLDRVEGVLGFNKDGPIWCLMERQ
jgi:hypothetical protein